MKNVSLLLLALLAVATCRCKPNKPTSTDASKAISTEPAEVMSMASENKSPKIEAIRLGELVDDNEFIIEDPVHRDTAKREVIILKDIGERTIAYTTVNGRALLLGSSIELMDNEYRVVKELSGYNGKMVNVLSASENLFAPREEYDYCKTYRGVKIATEGFEGIVDGRNVYMPNYRDNRQGKAILVDGKKVVFAGTEFFGVGVADEWGLTACYEQYYPMYFYDETTGYEGTVYVTKNDHYKKLYHENSIYPYFQLEASDGGYDEIERIEYVSEGKYLLHIHTWFQEGSMKQRVEVNRKENGTYVAEIVYTTDITYD